MFQLKEDKIYLVILNNGEQFTGIYKGSHGQSEFETYYSFVDMSIEWMCDIVNKREVSEDKVTNMIQIN